MNEAGVAKENIVIVGPWRSGKTTVAHGLFEQLSVKGKRVALQTGYESLNRRTDHAEHDITIWDMSDSFVPSHVTNDRHTRYITTGAFF